MLDCVGNVTQSEPFNTAFHWEILNPGTTKKGEDAILAQEEQLKSMNAEDIEKQMPALKHVLSG